MALVSLSDTLCAMRGLGYGFYEARQVDITDGPAWAILRQEFKLKVSTSKSSSSIRQLHRRGPRPGQQRLSLDSDFGGFGLDQAAKFGHEIVEGFRAKALSAKFSCLQE